MPQRLTIVPAKTRPEAVSDAEFQKIKRGGEKTVHAVTAFEAVKNSKGAYQIKEQARPAQVQSMSLEDMPNDKLKLLAVNLGIRFQKKQMSRRNLMALVRRKLEDAVTITDDDEVETEGEV